MGFRASQGTNPVAGESERNTRHLGGGALAEILVVIIVTNGSVCNLNLHLGSRKTNMDGNHLFIPSLGSQKQGVDVNLLCIGASERARGGLCEI